MRTKIQGSAKEGLSMLIFKTSMALVLLLTLGAQAQLTPGVVKSRTTGAGFTWTMGANFETAIAGLWTNNNDIANFNASGGNGAVGYPVSVVGSYAMTFQNGAGNWTFYGDPLTIGPGGITNSLTGATYGFAISNNVVLAASQAWLTRGHNRDNFKVMGDVSSQSGQTDLTFDGCYDGGTLRLFGANTFNGAMIVQNTGRLYLDYSFKPTSDKLNASYPLTIKNGGRVEWGGSTTVYTQSVSGLVIEGNGQAILKRENNASVLNVGPITRTADYSTLAVNNAANLILTSTDNINGILGPWAAFDGNWVSVSASDVIGSSSGTTQNDPTQWTATYNANVNASLIPAPTGAMSLNTLRLGYASGTKVVDLNGQTLTVNGIVTGNGENAIQNGTLQSGLSSGALFFMCSAAMTNAAAVQDNGAIPTVLVKAGMDNTRLSVTGVNTYTGDTYIHEGVISISGNGRLGAGVVYAKSRYVDGPSLTSLDFVGNCPNISTVKNIQGPIMAIQHSGTGGSAGLVVTEGTSSFYRLSQANVGGTFNFTANSPVNILSDIRVDQNNATLNLNSLDTLTNNIGSVRMGNISRTMNFQGGYWVARDIGGNGLFLNGTCTVQNATLDSFSGRYIGGQLVIKWGGAMIFRSDRFGFANASTQAEKIQTLRIEEGGTLDVYSTSWGSRLGGDAANSGQCIWVVQTGGLSRHGVLDGPNTSNRNFSFNDGDGGTASSSNELGYALSGGELEIAGTLKVTAKGVANTNYFDWTGGYLAAGTIQTTNFNVDADAHIIVNKGGVLCPGGKGYAGRTVITGTYREDSASAGLLINIRGATAATTFRNTGTAYGNVQLSNNGKATFQGQLLVNVLNYQPLSSTTFDIITTGSGCTLTANFSNLSSGKVTTQDGLYIFDVTVTATKVTLANCQRNEWVGGTSGDWATASNWALGFVPDTAAEWAYLGTTGQTRVLSLGSSAISLMGMTFDSQSNPYTVNGTGLLTFLNPSGISLNMLSGEATLTVPLALSNASEIAVAADSVLTLTGGITGGQAVTKTGPGTLALSASTNMLGTLTVSAGTVKQTAGTTTLASLTFAGGTFDLLAGILRITEGVDGGAIDTIAEVEAAITAGNIKGRGQTLQSSEFKISVVDGYVKVELKMRGTVISFQ